MEILIALGMVAVGFLGAFATVLHAERMTAAAEEDALISSGIDQRIDQLRTLQWDELTDGSGITTKVWTARPETVAGIPVTQETLTISAYDIANAKTLQAVWNGTSTPTATTTGAGPALSTARAVRVAATLTWSVRASARQQTRSVVAVISRGGISKSDL